MSNHTDLDPNSTGAARGWLCVHLVPTSKSWMDPAKIVSEAASFAASIDGHATLVCYRLEDGFHTAVMLEDTGSARQKALKLAQAVGASLVPGSIDDSVFSAPSVGVLRAARSMSLMKATQANIDPNVFSESMLNTLPVGAWVAISLRVAGGSLVLRERQRNQAWQQHRLGSQAPTHHSLGPSASIIQVTAGGEEWPQVREILTQVSSAMPGFDVQTVPKRVSHLTEAMRALPVAALACLPVALLTGVGLHAAGLNAQSAILSTTLWLFAMCLAVVFGLSLFGIVGTRRTKILRALDKGHWPRPPRRLSRPKRPSRGKTDDNGNVTGETDGDYPLHRDTFIVGPHVVIGLVSPQSGALSGSATSQVMNVPPALTDPSIGPFIGTGRNDDRAHLPIASSYHGIALVGQPDSGKSQLLRSIYGYMVLERMAPSGRRGFPGADNALIVFESKDGEGDYLDWARTFGDDVLLINPIDESTPAIDIFGVEGTLAERAAFGINVFKYGFEDGAIGDRNYVVLTDIFTVALYIDENPDILTRLHESEPAYSDLLDHEGPMVYANTLIGNRGDKRAVALANATLAHVKDVRESGRDLTSDERVIEDSLTANYLNRSETNRRNHFESSTNKIDQLSRLGTWWNPHKRPALTWRELLTDYRNVIITTGATNATIIAEKLGDQLSAMMLYTLQSQIKVVCRDWQAMGRSVSVFTDELAVLAGTSSGPLTWMRDQGRAYGVRPIFATQRPDQLDERVRTTFLNFSTLASFSQSDTSTAQAVAASLSGQVDEIDEAAIKHLGKYEIAVRTYVDQVRTPVFTSTVGYFEGDREDFARIQGYELPTDAPASALPAGEAETDDERAEREDSGAARPRDFSAYDDLFGDA